MIHVKRIIAFIVIFALLYPVSIYADTIKFELDVGRALERAKIKCSTEVINGLGTDFEKYNAIGLYSSKADTTFSGEIDTLETYEIEFEDEGDGRSRLKEFAIFAVVTAAVAYVVIVLISPDEEEEKEELPKGGKGGPGPFSRVLLFNLSF